MGEKLSVAEEGFPALGTRERFMTRVDLLMSGEVSVVAKAFPAYRAGKWLLAGVAALMDHQTAFVSESFAALGAGERFLPSVSLFMLFKLFLQEEGLVALRAMESLLVAVLPLHVVDHGRLLREPLPAFLALEGFLAGVSLLVLFQVTLVKEVLVAFGALKRSFTVKNSLEDVVFLVVPGGLALRFARVRLFVLEELIFYGEPLIALAAGERPLSSVDPLVAS